MRRKLGMENSSPGFTIIEALVALVILGIGMLSLAQLAPRASHTGMQGRRISEAMNLAQGKVEELRALSTESAELADGTHVDNADLGGYSRRWTVTGNAPITGMRKVEIRVAFTTSSADSVAVLTTYF